MLKNKDTSFNAQSISTDLVLNGNIYHNSGSYFNDNIYSNLWNSNILIKEELKLLHNEINNYIAPNFHFDKIKYVENKRNKFLFSCLSYF